MRALLARHIGPIAKVFVQNAATEARTPDDFCERLAAHVSAPSDRAAFLRQARERLARGAVAASTDIEAIQAFLERWPNGQPAKAEARIDALEREAAEARAAEEQRALETMTKRLKALEAKSAQDGLVRHRTCQCSRPNQIKAQNYELRHPGGAVRPPVRPSRRRIAWRGAPAGFAC